MATYHYKAIDARGEVISGQLDADGHDEVIAQLQKTGHLPVEARLSSELGWDPRRLWSPKRTNVDATQLLQFTRQLATLLGAGQPLERALTVLLDLPEGERARTMMLDIREAVRAGGSLSAALERQGGTFSQLYINMVRAGEAGGDVHSALERLADYLDRGQALRAKVINALIYPAILLVVVGLAVLFLLGYVVPQFAVMYESLDVALPWFTRATLAVGLFIGQAWWALLIVVTVGLLSAMQAWRSQAARVRLDAWLLKRRLVGGLTVRLETSRLARTLGTLLANGVPLLSALGTASAVVENRVLAADLQTAADAVRAGRPLSAALSNAGHFPALALQMIQVGEESGALDAMLIRVADTYEQETRVAIDRLLAALVPALTLLLASIVGVVIITVLVPLYDLTNAIG